MSEKKKILCLSDDLRMHSGIATQTKEFIMGTIHKYDWVQLGGAVKHPEQGKIIDMSPAVQKEYGVSDIFKLYDLGESPPVEVGEIYNDVVVHY